MTNERVVCTSHKFRKLQHLNLMQITFGIDLDVLNKQNMIEWTKFVSRHALNIFSADDIPTCLKLKYADRIVVETCDDEHQFNDIVQLGFLFDVTSIVDQYTLALLLARSAVPPPNNSLLSMQMKIFQSVMNPITQVYFSQGEMDFFIKVKTESEVKEATKSKFVNFLSYVRTVADVLSMPIIKNLVGPDITFSAKLVSQMAYWAKLKTQADKSSMITRTDDLITALRSCLVHLENETTEQKQKIYDIWRELDLEQIGQKVTLNHEISREARKGLSVLFQILITMVPLLGLNVTELFQNELIALIVNVVNGSMAHAETILGIMFKYIIPLKERSLQNIRDEPFAAYVYIQHNMTEKMYQNIYNILERSNLFKENVSSAIEITRDAFRLQFEDYIIENLKKLQNFNPLSDLYFTTCLMYDNNDLIKIKYKSNISKPVLQKRRKFGFVLYKPGF